MKSYLDVCWNDFNEWFNIFQILLLLIIKLIVSAVGIFIVITIFQLVVKLPQGSWNMSDMTEGT